MFIEADPVEKNKWGFDCSVGYGLREKNLILKLAIPQKGSSCPGGHRDTVT